MMVPIVDLANIGMNEAEVEEFAVAGRRAGGRPSLTGAGKHSPQVSFRVPDPVRERLEAIAAREGVSVSALARRALDEYLAMH